MSGFWKSVRIRIDTYLDGLPKATAVRDVGTDFALYFKDDKEVVAYALRELGIREWRKRFPVQRRGVVVAGTYFREDWWNITDPKEIEREITHISLTIRGLTKRRDDLKRILNAMRAWPEESAGEAVRLSGVKLKVFTMPPAKEEGEATA